MFNSYFISVVIPAHDEALSIGGLIQDIKKVRCDSGIPIVDQIVVCDNASKDQTADIARNQGALVVSEQIKGYGLACKKALSLTQAADIVVFMDADCAYDPKQLPTILMPFSNLIDIVIGSRAVGQIESGAMPWHQKLGNKLAASTVNLLFGTKITDLGPFRAIRRDVLNELQMQSNTFGWTVEMQVKAIILNKKMAEVPVTMMQRIGKSKISGTLKGSILACLGIFGTIFELRFKSFVNSACNSQIYVKYDKNK